MRYYDVSLSWWRTGDGVGAPVAAADLEMPVKAEDVVAAIRKAISVCGYGEPEYCLLKVEAAEDRAAPIMERVRERIAKEGTK